MRILFVGNSHTYVNDMPEIVKLNANEEIEVVMSARPGITFHDHLEDPSFHFMIKQPFDYVVIQQAAHSPCPSKEETLRDGKLMIEEAKENHQHVFVLVPWAHKNNDEAYSTIVDIYHDLCLQNGIEGIKCGEVITALQNELDLFYKDDEHLSPIGSYIEACCILKTLTNQDHFKGITLPTAFNSRKFEVKMIEPSIQEIIEKTIKEKIK